MPPLETMDLNQKAVYWPKVGDTIEGRPNYNPPQEIRVRWEDAHHEVLGPQGNTIAVSVLAITALPLFPQSILWPGTLLQWNNIQSGGKGSKKGMFLPGVFETGLFMTGMFRGIAPGTGPQPGTRATELLQVATTDITPDLKNRHLRFENGLVRMTDALPDQVG
jgi:hypothetical protein